jgi:hypothetical protein
MAGGEEVSGGELIGGALTLRDARSAPRAPGSQPQQFPASVAVYHKIIQHWDRRQDWLQVRWPSLGPRDQE